MGAIQSATGTIDTADLGFTLMHEHVAASWGPMIQQYPELFDRAAQMDEIVAPLIAAREAGVRTIVDLTPIDLGRDANMIREASARSGIQIIVATGLYYGLPYYFLYRPDQEMTDLFVRDITVGISTTGVRAGVIKCATEPDMHPANERVLRASAKAQIQTGVPICTHTHAHNRTGVDQIRIFKEEGVDLGRVVIGHSDDSDDISYLEEIIQSGAYCGMDRIGIQRPRTSEQRADMIAALVERGYADRITVSHDCSCRFEWAPDAMRGRSSTWRLTHIPQDVLPMLRERGVSEDAIRKITVANPKRIFGG